MWQSSEIRTSMSCRQGSHSVSTLLLWCSCFPPEACLLQSMMASLQDREAEMSSFVAAQQARHEQQEALKQVCDVCSALPLH